MAPVRVMSITVLAKVCSWGVSDLEEVPLACNAQHGKYIGLLSTKDQIKKKNKKKEETTKKIKMAGSLDGKSV